MENYIIKARNYYILARIAERINMNSEAASNYFKALFAIDDYILEKSHLKANDHNERFRLLKENFPEFYEISDKLFMIYRRTYNDEISKKEIEFLRKDIENVFLLAQIKLPDNEEINSRIEKASEK